MKEWLTFIIVLLIIGILLDGFRRMRAHRKEAVRLSKNMVDTDPLLDDDAPSGSEFPSGGARVASYREQSDLDNVHQSLKENYAASRVTRGAPRRQPEQESLNLDTPVPMLMESVRNNNEDGDDEAARNREPSLGDLSDLDIDEDQGAVEREYGAAQPEQAPEQPRSFPDNSVSEDEDDSAGDRLSAPRPAASKPTRSAEAEPVQKSEPKPAREAPREPSAEPANQTPDEVLVMNIMARRGDVFAGSALLQALIDHDMRYGEMDIFHRHEGADGRGKVLFSLANMVKPGVFDLAAMDEFQTPGVSLFLTLPINSDSLAAYNLMAATAQGLAEALDGELKDENRSVMTRQTIEHGRQRVIEYERKRRLAKA